MGMNALLSARQHIIAASAPDGPGARPHEQLQTQT